MALMAFSMSAAMPALCKNCEVRTTRRREGVSASFSLLLVLVLR